MEFLETLLIIELRLLKCQLSSRIIFSTKLVLGMVQRTFHDNSSPSFCNHPVSGSRRPPQLDLRLDGESPFSGQDRGLTADVRLSTILPAIMLERWHHSSVSYSTQVQLAPQSSKLGSCARSTSRGTVLRNQTISVYGRTGLIDMASCCRCTASTRGLAIRLIGSSGQRLFQHRHTDQTQK